ncbi:cytochrome P450 [Aspergillus costaricaensis CBS 115574]|uniref:Cytochrome P450 n=1 Tax=Aspergillus costaricaensis CBS 115574 TaxID=1448317 RepID=A0ACD1IIW5_9EURO|nr:cytochrome P450 [Aspergillus costaricaensis CBS 115574]RAK90517.1 cytochrome P450 [Aspergillus costaricaensis CBS 115574]
MLWSAIPLSLAIFLSAFVALQLYQIISRSYRYKRLSKEWNCEPVSSYPSGLFGHKAVWRARAATQEGQVGSTMHEVHLQYGNTLKLNFVGHDVVATCEPENIQAVLASQFSSFGLSKWRYPQYRPLLGRGIFTSDGSAWEHSRKLLRPQFTKNQMPSIEWFDSHSKNLMQALPPDGHVFDIQPLAFRLALDSATGYLFGESISSLVIPDSNQTGIAETSGRGNEGFAAAFDYAQDILFRRTLALSYYWLINPSEFRKSTHVVHKFVEYYVDKAIKYRSKINSPRSSLEEKEQEYCFLHALAAETQDRDFLRDQLVNVLLASRDDVASVLTSVFYLLSRDSAAWRKLKKEVSDAVEKHASNITLKEIQGLPYLRGVLYEALRLFPPVPLNARVAYHDTTIPVGGGLDGRSPVFIPKGQMVVYSVWCLHRRPDIWGADAETFQPERWEEYNPPAWDFVPFNGGPRACLGQQFAIILISQQVFRLVQHLDSVESAQPGPDMGLNPPLRQTLTMCHEHGVQLRIKRSKA